jgi:hypothetical protein
MVTGLLAGCARALAVALLCLALAAPATAARWLRSADVDDPPTLFPETDPCFSPYKADPLELRSGMKFVRTDLTDSTNVITAVGTRPVVYEFPAYGYRLQLLAGAVGVGRYDLGQETELVNEDWRYGFWLATRDGPWSYAISAVHLSSHLGDELLVRTGRRRIEYVLEELGLALSYDWTNQLRTYGGVNYAVATSHTEQKRRAQAGVEYWFEPRRVPGGLGPYVALDAQVREETDWKPGGTAILGFALPGWRRERTLDLQLTAAAGAAFTRQFYDQSETYYGVGFAVDL